MADKLDKVDKRKICTPERLAKLAEARLKASETIRNKKIKAQEEEERAKQEVLEELEPIVETAPKFKKKAPVQPVEEESEEEEEEYVSPPVKKKPFRKSKELSLIDRDELVSIIKQTLAPEESPEEKRLRKMEEMYHYIKSRDGIHEPKQKSFVEPPKRSGGNLSLW